MTSVMVSMKAFSAPGGGGKWNVDQNWIKVKSIWGTGRKTILMTKSVYVNAGGDVISNVT